MVKLSFRVAKERFPGELLFSDSKDCSLWALESQRTQRCVCREMFDAKHAARSRTYASQLSGMIIQSGSFVLFDTYQSYTGALLLSVPYNMPLH
mmetsp:Transcript_41962/g.71758  ORF Transcript_41962/g.71758 Transcript_41962/m.71758 type:complete len:94 (-) Transcript_41962:128-409(-)